MSDRLRAIDALIAEHCMGSFPTGKGSEFWRCYKQDAFTGEWHAPPYSADPAASKQARDKMRELGWAYSVDWLPEDMTGSPGVFCACFSRSSVKTVHPANADAEQLAVALAILAALNVTLPE